MLRAAKKIIKPAVLATSAALYRDMPIHSWPAWLGKLHDLTVPRGVVPHPVPQPFGAANINNLIELFEQTKHIDGDIAECGVYRGATLVPLARYVQQCGSKKIIHGFDSFSGFAESISFDVQLGGAHLDHKHAGGMNDTSRGLVDSKLDRFGIKNVRLHAGFFEKSLRDFSDCHFSLVHLDCDTYAAYKECLEFFYPRMTSRGIILFDEYDDPPWPGCRKAVDEFLIERPEKLLEIARDNYLKYYIQKL